MSGWGAVFNTVKMEPGKSLAVFGLGALGLSVIQAAKKAGATDIVGVDINDAKYEIAKAKKLLTWPGNCKCTRVTGYSC